MQTNKSKFLLTGQPGCGKTTVIVRLAELLEGRKLAGFFTREIRRQGQRIGFSIRTFTGKQGLLSSNNLSSGPRVGKYRVNIQGFEEIVLPELNKKPADIDVFLIDEIGKMECFSQKFVKLIKRILDGDVPVVAAVALKGKGVIAEIKVRNDVNVLEVTSTNRDDMPKMIADKLFP